MNTVDLVACQILLRTELEAQRPDIVWRISLVRRRDGGVRFFVSRATDSRGISGRFATVACEDIKEETARQIVTNVIGQLIQV